MTSAWWETSIDPLTPDATKREPSFVTKTGAQLLLRDVAKTTIEEGPPMLRSENARLSGWVYVDGRGRDLRSDVKAMQAAVASKVQMPAGYSVSWSGQFEYLERATECLKFVVMAAVPVSLIGGLWLVGVLGHSISVATAVGFIALAGLAAEFGVVMLIYLKNAHARHLAAGEPDDQATLLATIREGAVLRVGPKAMTGAVVMAGLLLIM